MNKKIEINKLYEIIFLMSQIGINFSKELFMNDNLDDLAQYEENRVGGDTFHQLKVNRKNIFNLCFDNDINNITEENIINILNNLMTLKKINIRYIDYLKNMYINSKKDKMAKIQLTKYNEMYLEARKVYSNNTRIGKTEVQGNKADFSVKTAKVYIVDPKLKTWIINIEILHTISFIDRESIFLDSGLLTQTLDLPTKEEIDSYVDIKDKFSINKQKKKMG